MQPTVSYPRRTPSDRRAFSPDREEDAQWPSSTAIALTMARFIWTRI